MVVIPIGIAMVAAGCQEQYDMSFKDSHMTYILPGGIECVGRLTRENTGAYMHYPMLICDDGRTFHNISNYQAVKQINPLYNGK
jgi:hypothetical protein